MHLVNSCDLVTHKTQKKNKQTKKQEKENKNKEARDILPIASIHLCSSGKDPFLNIYFDHLCYSLSGLKQKAGHSFITAKVLLIPFML